MSLHGVKPLRCSYPGCLVRGRSAAELRVHAVVHSSERLHECRTCAFRAKTKSLLARYCATPGHAGVAVLKWGPDDPRTCSCRESYSGARPDRKDLRLKALSTYQTLLFCVLGHDLALN